MHHYGVDFRFELELWVEEREPLVALFTGLQCVVCTAGLEHNITRAVDTPEGSDHWGV